MLKQHPRQLAPGSPSAANDKLKKAVKSMFAEDEQLRNAELSVRAGYYQKGGDALSGSVESEARRSRARGARKDCARWRR